MIPYIINKNSNGELVSISTYIDGEPYQCSRDHVNFDAIKDLLFQGSDDEQQLFELFNVKKTIEENLGENIVLNNGCLFYKGRQIHNKVCDLILEYIKEKYEFSHLVKFLSKLMENPSKRSTDLAWEYLSRYNMPITPEGNFLAMKVVHNNFTDKHSGKIDNSVGKTVSMPRNEISDDPDHACGVGLHCAYIDFVKSFGRGDDQVILLEVNPRDIVSVPKDHHMQKMRVCEYKVIKSLGEYNTFFNKERRPFASNAASDVEEDYSCNDYTPECGCEPIEENICPKCGNCDFCCEC